MLLSAQRRWILLATVSAGLLLITLDNSILYTALPTLTRELGATATESLWIINAYPLVMAGLLLGAGTLGDRVGHTRMFVIGLAVFGTASLVAAFSPSALVLILARGLLAVGAAAMMPATLALIRLAFADQRERNLAIAVWGSVAIVGAALGPIAGGLLLEWFWWGSVFLVNVPIVVIALVATLLVAPRTAPDRSRRWDLLSSVQALVGLAALVVALKELTKPGTSWPVAGVALVLAVVAFGFFTRRQRRLEHPLLDLAIFRDPVLVAGVVVAGVSLFAVAGVELVTAQRFQVVEGFTPLQAGFLVASLAVGSLPTSLLGGAILHRTGPRPLIVGGLGIATVGAVASLFLLPAGWGWLIVGLVVAGAGLGFVMACASSVIMSRVPAHRAGMASSVEEVSYELGSLVAVAVLGSVVTSAYGVGHGVADAGGASGVVVAASDTGFSTVIIVVAAVLAVSTVLAAVLLRGAGRMAGHDPLPSAGPRDAVDELDHAEHQIQP
ncbi:MFS transporter [Herbiconiux sp. P17]|uniref:MFS transporter n=1 Tax=Herbiconiux wuyangfengii TaxID=3342794 RepID=UPI0035BACE45